jgi:hypothetical protein
MMKSADLRNLDDAAAINLVDFTRLRAVHIQWVRGDIEVEHAPPIVSEEKEDEEDLVPG